MRRWIATAALIALSGAAVLSTASCGSQQATDAPRGDGGGGVQDDGAGGGDSTTGGYSPDSGGQGDDGNGGGDSTLGDDSSGGGGGDDGGGNDSAGSDDGGGSSGSSSGGACVPATACPVSYHCGRYIDPCTGNAMVCGSPCTGGEVCVSGGGDSLVCQPRTCTNSCGIIEVDGCGVPVNCGGCTGGKVCIGNSCVVQPTGDAAAATCEPLTCTPSTGTYLCGTVGDICGNSKSCSCPSGQQCIAGVCSPPPPECGDADAGFKCGQVANACGSGNVTCSACPSGTQCVAGTCETCPAPVCGAATCGTATNACGAKINCGTGCDGGMTCNAGACCQPSTCADAVEAGIVPQCGTVDLGCGVHASCSGCDGGDMCTGNLCVPCVEKTCADYGNAGCGHAIGCGASGTLNCCAAGTTCNATICCPAGETNMNGICCPAGESNVSGICCPAGEVNYGGTCCKPTCNFHEPGAQVSCGVTLYCAG